MLYILLLMVPFIQIGITYYASFQTVAAALLFVYTFRYVEKNTVAMWFAVIIVALLMMISAFSTSSTTGEDVFRRGREVLFFMLICLSARGLSIGGAFRISRHSHLPIVYICVALALLAAVQFVKLGSGSYLGLAKTLYITNADTLPDLLDLKYGKLRPFGTFGEPSYFAFVLLSFFIMLSPLVRFRFRHDASDVNHAATYPTWLRSSSSGAIIGCGAIVFAGMLGQSLSFYLAFPILLYLCVVRFSSKKMQYWFTVGGACLVFLLLLSSFAGAVFGRFGSGGTDVSTSSRFIQPMQIIPQFLMEHPTGVPLSKWLAAISSAASAYGFTAAAIGDNAFFNSFFNYGFIGFACLALMIGSPKNIEIKVYVALSFLFNGAIYSVDKYVVMALTIAVYYSYVTAIQAARIPTQLQRQPVRAPATRRLGEAS